MAGDEVMGDDPIGLSLRHRSPLEVGSGEEVGRERSWSRTGN